MTLKEARENVGKQAYLIDREGVLIIKVVGTTSCLTLAGPELDKYTYVQLENLISAKKEKKN